MRVRSALLFALAAAPLALPLVAHATGIPYFGPIVPTLAQDCAAGWGSILQLVNNLIAFAITIGIVFIAPLLIAYAGFLYVVNPVNPSGRQHANAILLNTIVGIVIALAAWLIVNAVLVALTTKGGVAEWTKEMFSKGGDSCLKIAKELNQAPNNATDTGLYAGGGTGLLTPDQACADHNGLPSDAEDDPGAGVGANEVRCKDGSVQSTKVAPGTPLTPSQACVDSGGVFEDEDGASPAVGSNKVKCANGDVKDLAKVGSTVSLNTTGSGGACDPAVVKEGAAAGGYDISNSQANTLACIAKSESTCGTASVKNVACWNKDCGKGSASSAAGAWQVLLGTNGGCYENPVCLKAAGGSGALGCKSAFSNGFEKTDATSQATIQRCLQAAANTQCSAASAACLVKANKGFGDWSNNSTAMGCVNEYGT